MKKKTHFNSLSRVKKQKKALKVKQAGKTVYTVNEEERDDSRILMLEGDFFSLLHCLGLRSVEKPLLLLKIVFTIQEMLPS